MFDRRANIHISKGIHLVVFSDVDDDAELWICEHKRPGAHKNMHMHDFVVVEI